MHILYQIPGSLSEGPLGAAELRRRAQILQGWANPGTEVEVADTPGGPLSIESAAEDAVTVAPMVGVLQARATQPDAVVIGCFGDPGLAALREILDCPVIGPFEASFHLALQLGRRVGLVAVLDNVVPLHDHLVRAMGESLNYAGAAALNIKVLDLGTHASDLPGRVAEVARRLVEHRGADVILLGCMSMSFLQVAEQASVLCGVPVINPARSALKVAEMIVALQLTQSRRTYPKPPKAVGRQKAETSG